jgi:hypothetical protein
MNKLKLANKAYKLYEQDISKIIQIIGSDFDDAFELKQKLLENFNKFKNITYLSRYIIGKLL